MTTYPPKYALLGECTPKEAIDELKRKGFEPLIFPKSPFLEDAVAAHIDMLLCVIDDVIMTSESYYDNAKENFLKLSYAGYKIVPTSDAPRSPYPYDVAFNAAIVGRKIICNPKYVSKALLKTAEEKGYRVIPVKQGYAKCLTVILNDNAIMTSDKGILRAAEAAGIDALPISEGGVRLKGYDHGFLGGASGIDGNELFFIGDIKNHPDHEAIVSFCDSLGIRVTSVDGDELTDVGSVFFL